MYQEMKEENDSSHWGSRWSVIICTDGTTEMWRKQLYVYFKQYTKNMTHENNWKWLREGDLKRETESLLMATENYAISTDYA